MVGVLASKTPAHSGRGGEAPLATRPGNAILHMAGSVGNALDIVADPFWTILA